MFRVAALVSGSGVLSALLVSQFRVHASSKKEDGKKGWDFNWDRMGHSSATHPHAPEGESPSVVKPSATRTLILIRHGQYEYGQDDPDKRILTSLGREQASLTGERLKEIGEKYTTIHYSTMPRATETANIISKSLPDVPMKSCDMLREGAPIRPEPPHSTWKPEEYVSINSQLSCLYMCNEFAPLLMFLEEFFRDGARIEAAFRKYFHRAPPTQETSSIEVLVCHANVIRYFICRYRYYSHPYVEHFYQS